MTGTDGVCSVPVNCTSKPEPSSDLLGALFSALRYLLPFNVTVDKMTLVLVSNAYCGLKQSSQSFISTHSSDFLVDKFQNKWILLFSSDSHIFGSRTLYCSSPRPPSTSWSNFVISSFSNYKD